MTDPEVNEVTCLCSAQSGKTVLCLVFVLWAFANDPGPTLWVTSSTNEAKKVSNTRLRPALELCEPLRPLIPREKGKNKTTEVHLPGGPLVIAGASDDKALEGTPYRYVILDERAKYKPGRAQLAKKRTRSYPNYKLITITTPWDENDDAHSAFLEGDQCEFEVKCPCCAHPQAMKWGEKDKRGGMKFDISDEAYNGGIYDMRLILPTIRWECRECGHAVRNNPVDRKALQATGKFVKRNPGHDPKKRSFTWNALLPWWGKWDEAVGEYLYAIKALKYGHIDPFKVFVTGTLGLPFGKSSAPRDESDMYVANRKLAYDPRGKWEEEVVRFCTVDVQGAGGRHFYYEIAAWSKTGASRRIAVGKAWSIAELRSVIAEYGVQPCHVGIDTGAFTQEVYRYIMESGKLADGSWAWKAMKGDKAPGYFIDGIRYPFTVTQVDPGMGTEREMRLTPITQILFSKSWMLDMCDLAMRGGGAPWHIPKEASVDNPGGWDAALTHEYCLQVSAYERKEERDAVGAVKHLWVQTRDDDHWGSCTRMQTVCAITAGLIPIVGAQLAADESGRMKNNPSA